MTREELIELVKSIQKCEGTEEQIDANVKLLEQNILDSEVSDYIFWKDLSAEEVVDKALKYKPIITPYNGNTENKHDN